ncbi:hypothetical protein ACWX0K_20530 [Nitrobacteraceae bacterium UC4446_H13]
MFRVGQKVECIREPLPGHGCPYPIFEKGAIYTVASIEIVEDETFITAVELHPLVSGEIHGFRPIVSRPTSIEFAHEILRKATRTDEVSA